MSDVRGMSVDTNIHFTSKSFVDNTPREFLLDPDPKQNYNFQFSTKEDVRGQPSICRRITICLLILATVFLPMAILIDS